MTLESLHVFIPLFFFFPPVLLLFPLNLGMEGGKKNRKNKGGKENVEREGKRETEEEEEEGI